MVKRYLMSSLVAQREVAEESDKNGGEEKPPPIPTGPPAPIAAGPAVSYWLTSVKSNEERTVESVIETFVGDRRIYAFGEHTPGRKSLKPGDWICFYATGSGVVASAKVKTMPERKPIVISEKYPWVFEVESPSLFLDKPVIIDADLRARLDAFQNRAGDASWAWFVQATHKVSKHDFEQLTQ